MNNKILKIASIIMVVLFAATSFAAITGSGNQTTFGGNRINTVVKPMNTHSTIDNITVGAHPFGIAYDSSNGYVYVINYGSGDVSVINKTNKVIDTIRVATSPYGVAYDPSNGYVYVTNAGSGDVSVINKTNKVFDTIKVATDPYDVAYDPSNGYVYVTNSGSNNVSVINKTNKVIDTIRVGTYPEGVAYDPSNGYVYVPNSGSGNVSVINKTNKVIDTIRAANNPYDVAYDPSNGYVYVTNYGYVTNVFSGDVSVINKTNKVIDTIGVGGEPQGVAFDSSNGYVYVTNYYSNNVTVISQTYSVTFKESGLPYGTEWYVNLTGHSYSSTTNKIAFKESNGTYQYTVGTSDHINFQFLHSGSFTVKNTGVSEPVIFHELYKVIFKDYDLPAGIGWYVNITKGNGTKYYSGMITGTDQAFSITNGSYTYTIATTNKTYHADGGSLYVSGNPLLKNITFSIEVYSVEFIETGLPSTAEWYVNLSNGMKSGAISVSSYSFSMANGSYTYTIATTSKTYHANGGSVNVDGSPIFSIVVFSEETYSVQFRESGLPYGTVWYVTIDGNTKVSVTNTITFSLVNDTYTYKITEPDILYTSVSSTGSIMVKGNSLQRNITFIKEMYKVTFNETGLSSGTSWYINISESNGTVYQSSAITGSSNLFSLPNGSYTYIVGTTSKIYHADGGLFNVNGLLTKNKISVSFSKEMYTVTFTESGMPAGTIWYVNGSMTGHAMSGSTVSFSLTNGTYSFSVTNTITYYTTATQFTVTVNGKNMKETVTYNHYSYITGIISPGNANVTINGKIINLTTTGSFNTTVTAGSYDLVISEKGYITHYDNLTISSGETQNVSYVLKKTTKPGLSGTEIDAIVIGTIAAVAVIGSVVMIVRRKM